MDRYKIKNFEAAFYVGIDTLVLECVKSHIKAKDIVGNMVTAKKLAAALTKQLFVSDYTGQPYSQSLALRMRQRKKSNGLS